MTGYGRGAHIVDGRDLTIELKSVNHRFLDLAFRMPRSFAYLEDALRQQIQSRLARGHVDIFVTYRNLRDDSRTVAVDHALVKGYTAAMDEMAELTGLKNDLSLPFLGSAARACRRGGLPRQAHPARERNPSGAAGRYRPHHAGSGYVLRPRQH